MYGSSFARAVYGVRAPQYRAAYTRGYYAAGGFFSSIKKLAGKAVSKVQKVAATSKVARVLTPVLAAANTRQGMSIGAGIAGGKLARFIPPGKTLPSLATLKSTSLPVTLAKVAHEARQSLQQRAFPGSPSWAGPVVAAGGAALGFWGPKPPANAGVDIGMVPSHGPALPAFGGPKKKRKKRTTTQRRRRRATSRRRPAPRRRAAPSRRRRRAYPRGDYGDDWVGNRPSRAKGSGQFLTRVGGRRRKRRRGRGRGGRVSFVTKSGRRVTFNAR